MKDMLLPAAATDEKVTDEVALWEPDWDDDATKVDFSTLLRAELDSKMKE